MLRFLKWIFLIFGGLALGIMTFFFIQNKHDLTMAYEHRTQLNYAGMRQTCLNVEKEYYFPCFKESFSKYLQKVSMTGMSLGLKIAFNFIDDDKANTKYFDSELERDLTYSLHYLEINNLAVAQSYKRFFGLDFTYGGFVGKVQDNLDRATMFSEGIIKGLQGKDGITKLNNPALEEQMHTKLSELENDFAQKKNEVTAWLKVEIAALEEKYN